MTLNPEELDKRRAEIIEKYCPETPCTGWPCEVVKVMAHQIAFLEAARGIEPDKPEDAPEGEKPEAEEATAPVPLSDVHKRRYGVS